MVIYFVTGSKDKLIEAQQIIPEIKQVSFDLPEIQSLDAREIIRHKLNEALKTIDDAVIVEDTALHLDCINSLPGPLIKWFMNAVKKEGLWRIADLHKDYGATARTIIGYTSKEQVFHFFEGELKGTIVEPKGDKGFGWDAIFQPDNYSVSMGELSLEEKNKISMRSIAFKKLREFLLVN